MNIYSFLFILSHITTINNFILTYTSIACFIQLYKLNIRLKGNIIPEIQYNFFKGTLWIGNEK